MPMQTALIEDLRAVTTIRSASAIRSAASTAPAPASARCSRTRERASGTRRTGRRRSRRHRPALERAGLLAGDQGGACRRYTDRNLLAAVDLKRNAAGAIEHRARPIRPPTARSCCAPSSSPRWSRCFCAAIGLPYAMLAAARDRLEAHRAAARRAAAALDLAAGAHGGLADPAAGTRADQQTLLRRSG